MFQSLRQNSQVYIFHKGDKPSLEIGFVSNTPITKPKYSVPAAFGQPQELIVDLTVKVNNQTFNYNGVPAHLDIADTYVNGENLVISDNRNAINAEIISYKQRSIDAINSVEQHKQIINSCEDILKNLNPEYADKQQQQAELNDLKNQINQMSQSMTQLMEANKLLISQLNRKEDKNEQNVGNS